MQLHNAENYAEDGEMKNTSVSNSAEIPAEMPQTTEIDIPVPTEHNACTESQIDVIKNPKSLKKGPDEEKIKTCSVKTENYNDKLDNEKVSNQLGTFAKRQKTGPGMLIPEFDTSKMNFDPKCPDCQLKYKDPTPEDLVMYLHALKYKVPLILTYLWL